MKKYFCLILFFVFFITFRNICFGADYIRVLVLQDEPSISLRADGLCELRDAKTGRVLYSEQDLRTTVAGYKTGISFGQKSFYAGSISIVAKEPDLISINGREFRGEIRITRNDKGKLSAINYIELEDYVKGILYHEASHYWPVEALKAQAVVSRTYALYQSSVNKNLPFDLTSDIYSQVYGGKTSERFRTNSAVDETKGEVIEYKGKIIPAYFHATCGGYTEDASMLWNIDLPPLKGVRCDYCKDSPHFNWHYVLTSDEISEALAKAGYKIRAIKDILILGKDKSGRATDLEIISEKKELKISVKDFRNIIGPNIIRSARFSVSVINSDVVFEGLGWGHGVGLCQWGAYFMAKYGASYKKILEYYYPGANVKAF